MFIAEKPFTGCGGLTITDEIRETVAALACLFIINRPEDGFGNAHQVLVYPDAFVVNQSVTDFFGTLQNQSQVLSGRSWARGQVNLSWKDAIGCVLCGEDAGRLHSLETCLSAKQMAHL